MTFLFKSDPKSDLKSDQGRSGSSAARKKNERYFHVLNLGWFIYTREADDMTHLKGIEMQDGMVGPFDSRKAATKFLQHHIIQNKIDRGNESWRYE